MSIFFHITRQHTYFIKPTFNGHDSQHKVFIERTLTEFVRNLEHNFGCSKTNVLI